MMDCENYKLIQTADPASVEGAEHLASCADCRQYDDELQVLNGKIAQALDIAVPELKLPELPELVAENVAVLHPRRAVTKPVWFALAASIMVAVFIGVSLSGVDDADLSIVDQLLAHIDHEPYALRSVRPVSAKRLAKVVPASIATMDNEAGLITYAQSCVINGRDVPHLVIQGENGPVTILLMPKEAISEKTAVDGESVHGFIFPFGDGSFAIIGEKGEPIDQMKRRVMESVTWDI